MRRTASRPCLLTKLAKSQTQMSIKPRVVISVLIVVVSLIAPIASALPSNQGLQTPARERRALPTPATSPTPPVPDLPATSATPTPSASPTPAILGSRSGATTRSVSELQARILEVLRKPELDPAIVGVKVVSGQTGKVLFEENAQKLLKPASNMKLYTVAAAFDRLTPDYRFLTSIYARGKPDAAGVVRGDLIVYGRGDPSISFRFNDGDYFKGINELAARIVAAGVKRVEGDLVGDETYFTGPPYGGGWEWEDLQWWYGAEVSSLTVNDNFVELSVKPGAQPGAPANVVVRPPAPLLIINNRVTTTAKGTTRALTVHRPLSSDVLELTGTVPVDDAGYSGRVAVSRPGLLFCYLLRAALAQQGVTMTGKTRLTPAPVSFAVPSIDPASSGLVELVSFQSQPFHTIAAQTMKPSQNLYTELILRTLGRVAPVTPVQQGQDGRATITSSSARRPSRTSEEAGVEVVRAMLKDAGVASPALVLSDGSGLSRTDMITADATVQLLTYMRRHRFAAAFRDSLPIAGVDGTLRNRMKGTAAENNLRAKTGTLSSASSLSGYVTTAGGEDLVFSIMVNNYPEDLEVVSLCIDPIAVLLASFAGKS